MKTLTSEYFSRALETNKPVLVEFSAPWCTYCRRIESAMNAVAAEQSDALEVYSVNIDNCPELVNAYSIELVPTLILFQNGQPVDNIVAPGSKAEIDAFLSKSVTLKAQDSHVYDMIVISEVFLSECHPETSTFDSWEVFNERLQLFVVEEV